jgi:hypothetical protein
MEDKVIFKEQYSTQGQVLGITVVFQGVCPRNSCGHLFSLDPRHNDFGFSREFSSVSILAYVQDQKCQSITSQPKSLPGQMQTVKAEAHLLYRGRKLPFFPILDSE